MRGSAGGPFWAADQRTGQGSSQTGILEVGAGIRRVGGWLHDAGLIPTFVRQVINEVVAWVRRKRPRCRDDDGEAAARRYWLASDEKSVNLRRPPQPVLNGDTTSRVVTFEVDPG